MVIEHKEIQKHENWKINWLVLSVVIKEKHDLTQQNMQINSSCSVMSIAIVPTWLDYHLGADDNWLIESVPWGAVQ